MKKLSALLTAALLAAAPLAYAAIADKPADKTANTYQLLNLFGEVFEKVKDDYVEEVKDEDLIENAINGMLSALDPHSGYMNAKAFNEMQIQTKGEFGGLGIEITMENGLVKVVSPIDDTPAFKAGVKAGDYISYINDEQVMGLTLSEAVDKMRGPVGTKVKITVLREGAKEPLDFNIVRDTIKIVSVKAREEKDVGYLRITSFSEMTADNLKKEINKMMTAKTKPAGFVLDLRNNPGGLLDQAIEVADSFLDKGEIVSTRGRVADSAKRYNATKGDLTGGLPVVVLINGGSASASEIVAGALQDHKRAVVMGTKSFGKGSVQTVIPLTGHGAMRLTTSRYYTPSGNSIQAVGITPDIEVEQAKIEAVQSLKMRQEADLKGHLENLKRKKEEEKKRKEEEAKAAGDKKDGKAEKGENGAEADKAPPKEGDPQTDFQLARAIDLLKGLSVFTGKEAQK